MHILNYLYLAYEALPQEEYDKRPFDNVKIQYKKEIKLGEDVICKYAKQNEKSIVTIYDKDDEILHAIIEVY